MYDSYSAACYRLPMPDIKAEADIDDAEGNVTYWQSR